MSVTYVPIFTQTLSASVTNTITFSNIPQTYTDLVLVMSLRSSANDGTQWRTGSWTINGDSSTNYSVIYNLGSGAGTGAGGGTSITYLPLWITGSLNSSGVFSNTEAYIPNYTATGSKQIISKCTAEHTGATGLTMVNAALYRGTAPVTSLSVSEGGSGYVQNSTISLYGVLRPGL